MTTREKLQGMLATANDSDKELISCLISNIDNGIELTKENVPLHIGEKLFAVNIISARQARLVLLNHELLDDIELLLANDKALQIWWEYSIEIERDNHYLVQAASQLGITDEQLDAMFLEASKL